MDTTDPLLESLNSLTVSSNFFQTVAYFVSGKVDPRIIKLLESGGARRMKYISCSITHFFAGRNPEPDQVEEAKEIFDIPICSPRWVLYSAKIQKLLPVYGFKNDSTHQLFSKFNFTTSKVKGEDLRSIWALITYHNGNFLTALTKYCTHLLTNECTGQKYQTARKLNMHVVCIDWVTDSIKAGKLMDEKAYDPALLLPPQVLAKSQSALPNNPTSNQELQPKSSSVSVNYVGDISSKITSLAPSKFNRLATAPSRFSKKLNPVIEQKPQIVDRLNGLQSFQHQEQTQQSATPHSHSSQQNVTRLVFHQQPNSSQSQVKVIEKSHESSENNVSTGNSVYNNAVIRSAPNDEPKLFQTHQPPLEDCQRVQFQQNQVQIQQNQTQSQPQTQPQQNLVQLHHNQVQSQQNLTQPNPIQAPHQQNQSQPQQNLTQPQQNQSPHQQNQSLSQQNLIHHHQNQAQHQQNLTQPQQNQSPHQQNQSLFQQNLIHHHQNQAHSMQNVPQPQQNQVLSQQNVPQSQPTQILSQQNVAQSQPTQILSQQNVPQSQPNQAQPPQNQSQLQQSQAQSQNQAQVQQNQTAKPYSVQDSRYFSNSEQLEIIRQIQNDPQIKLQWAQMDTKQRTLLVQQLAQKNREERLRREMMVRQQQMQMNSLNHQNLNSKGSSEQITNQQQQPLLNHSPQTPTQQSPPSRSTVPQNQAIIFQQNMQMRSRFPSTRPPPPPSGPVPQVSQPGFQTPPSNRQPQPAMAEVRPDQNTQQQQWTIRTQTPHQGGVIYTNQPNMPYAQVVNPKTKTALANLLSNRLMGSTTPEATTSGNPYPFSYGVTGSGTGTVLSRSPSPQSVTSTLTSPVQNRVPVQSQSGKPQSPVPQRRTLSNLTNNDKVPLSNNISISPRSGGSGSSPQSPSPSYTSQSARFFGHDPSIKLPDGGFLLGCVFWGAQTMKITNWQDIVTKYGGEIDAVYNPRVTHVLCETQKFPEFQQCVREGKRLVTLFWLNDVISRRFLSSPSQALHLPLPFSENEKPYYGELISITGFTSEEQDRVRAMCSLLGLLVTQVFTRANIGLIAKKPEGEKFLMAREWKKPVVNIQFLNELLFGHTGVIQMIHSPKYQQFNMASPFSFDVGLVVPLMAPWKTPLRVSNEAFERFRQKRPAETSDADDDSKRLKLELLSEVEQAKEQLFPVSILKQEPMDTSEEPMGVVNSSPFVGVYVILTGFDIPMKELLTEKIMELRGRVTEDRHIATHLIAKENTLTRKLLTFLCIKDKIMKLEWLRDSYAQKQFLMDDSYVASKWKPGIYEIDFTEIFKIPNRNRLFSGLTFYLTPTVNNDDMKAIIEAAGGSFDHQKSLNKVYQTAIKTPDAYVIVTCEFDEYLLNGWKGNEGVEKLIVITQDTIFGWIVTQNINRIETKGNNSKITTSDLLSLSSGNQNQGMEIIPIGS